MHYSAYRLLWGSFCLINACVPPAAEDILDAPSYPCPLQFFTSNGQVWSASRIDVATASPVVLAKLTNPRNSSCILQVSSTNRIDMQSCQVFETSVVSSGRIVKKGACSGISLIIWFLKYSIVIGIMPF